MKIIRIHSIALAAAAFVLVASSGARAIPSLQVYVPGGTYDVTTETWTTTSSSFTVWVVASEPMTGVTLAASIGNAAPSSGSLDIGAATYSGSDFTSGHHPLLPDHGIFPTNWVEHSVGDMTTMSSNSITDFNDSYVEGVTPLSSSGQVMMFNIEVTGFEQVHFDAFGYNSRGQFRKAPFSHDAGGTPVPEPATLLLFGIGASAIGLHRRRKARKAKNA